MSTVFQQYLDAVQESQRRMLAAQNDCWRSWCEVGVSLPEKQTAFERFDAPILSGASVMQASADAQHDLMLVLERWLAEQQKGWFSKATSTTPSAACIAPLNAGLTGYLIASRATRQIHHFASTRFSYAALTAVHGARHAYQRSAK